MRKFSFFSSPLGGCFFCLLLLLPVSCGRIFSKSPAVLPPPFQLTLTPDKQEYLPGEPVVVAVELASEQYIPRRLPALDHASVVFVAAPAEEGKTGNLRTLFPVYSEMETVGALADLEPRGSFKRRFLFTVLTLERGDFVLQGIYSMPGQERSDLMERVYSEPVGVSVQGDDVFVHRYRNGLVTRDDAIALAMNRVDAAAKTGEAVLVKDEKGFPKWWVNVHCEKEGSEKEVRSFFVDPHLGRVWAEAEPFEKKEEDGKPPFPEDSKIMQELRDKSRKVEDQKVENRKVEDRKAGG